MAEAESDREHVTQRQQEQKRRAVTKGFYNQLTNYGFDKSDIVAIATDLLSRVLKQDDPDAGESVDRFYSRYFRLDDVDDRWTEDKQISIDDAVFLRPLDTALIPEVARWLADPKTRANFVTPYPEDEDGLAAHFERPSCRYFAIRYQDEDEPVGIIGAESVDDSSLRLEMRKLVGRGDLRGRGIGKRATFAFLYYAFQILGFEKVYIYSTDLNVRNLNLNSHFGFSFEGVFSQELRSPEGGRRDVVRMGLMRDRWREIFS